MSGGRWNYASGTALEWMKQVSQDPEVRKRWPQTAAMFEVLAPELSAVEHAMDWDLSGDSSIVDDGEFDTQCVAKILDAVLKKVPDAWFPRGKWATIQAVQGRAR